MAVVRVGDWVASSEAVDGFTLDKLEGWFSGVDVRRNEVPRPQAFGSFSTPGYGSSRVVSVSGLCYATSADQLNYFGDTLTGLLGSGAEGTVLVDMPWGTTTAVGRLASAPQFDVLVWGEIASYQIQFWCPNPRKFGETRTFGPSGTSVSAYQFGNFPASPVLTLGGTMTGGYTVTGPSGKTFQVDTNVTPTDIHTIDLATGILRIDNTIVTGHTLSADTWTVPPGPGVTHTLTPVSGTAGTITVTLRDTYI